MDNNINSIHRLMDERHNAFVGKLDDIRGVLSTHCVDVPSYEEIERYSLRANLKAKLVACCVAALPFSFFMFPDDSVIEKVVGLTILGVYAFVFGKKKLSEVDRKL